MLKENIDEYWPAKPKRLADSEEGRHRRKFKRSSKNGWSMLGIGTFLAGKRIGLI